MVEHLLPGGVQPTVRKSHFLTHTSPFPRCMFTYWATPANRDHSKSKSFTFMISVMELS